MVVAAQIGLPVRSGSNYKRSRRHKFNIFKDQSPSSTSVILSHILNQPSWHLNIQQPTWKILKKLMGPFLMRGNFSLRRQGSCLKKCPELSIDCLDLYIDYTIYIMITLFIN